MNEPMEPELLFDIPIRQFDSSNVWEDWLKINHGEQVGVWVKIAKKNSGIVTVNYGQALDVALCYGWIDGQRRSYNEVYFLQKFTPRRKKSLWSKVNIAKVEALIASGKMQQPGIIAIKEAQSDGRWDAAYDSQKNATDPEDLIAALGRHPRAKKFYETLTRAEKYSVLWQLMTAKTSATREVRLTKILSLLEKQQKP